MDRSRTIALWFGTLVCFAAPAWAVDGVIEINQAAVFAGGITPGDTPGYPATVSQSGSYRLTGNLDVTKLQNGDPAPSPEDITAIEINADNVTVDLNGFAIGGPTTCTTASPPVCSSTGTGVGVKAEDRRALTIVNGVVHGLGADGIKLMDCPEAHIERVSLHDLGGDFAILCGRDCQVIDNQISDSMTQGINAGSNGGSNGSLVRGNTMSSLASTGIVATGHITGNAIRQAQVGISVGAGSSIIGNRVSNCRATGIFASVSTIINNQVNNNAGPGVFISSSAAFDRTGSLILGNGIAHNVGLGIGADEAAGQIGFGQNVLNGNNGGNANPQTVAGLREIPAGSNVCGGDLVCP